jgi:hypothetical protein
MRPTEAVEDYAECTNDRGDALQALGGRLAAAMRVDLE